MIVIPAIDIKNKKCVMLRQGVAAHQTVYSDNPLEVANFFCKEGATYLHIVDLDAALSSTPREKTTNRDIIVSIREKFENLRIEIGGGIRSAAAAKEFCDYGFDYVIMGTSVVKNPDEFRRAAKENPSRIMAACDVNSDGEVMISGWLERTKLKIEDVLRICSDVEGIRKAIIITDVSSDGMLSGVKEDFYKKLVPLFNEYGFRIIVSGGVSSLEDIKTLKAINNSVGESIIEGVIVGKALYEKKFTLKEAIASAAGL